MKRMFSTITARLMLICLLALPTALAQSTPAGSVIRNQAFANYLYEGREMVQGSNIVETVVQQVCSLSILPSGLPAHTATALPGDMLIFPYTLANTGNAANRYLLDLVLLPDSSLSPEEAVLVWDVDGDGQPGPDEPRVDTLTDVPADALVPLLLIVTVHEDEARSGEMWIDVQGACLGEPASRDTGNVTHITVTVPVVGFTEPVKTFEAPAGTLAFGDTVRYRIAFTAHDAPLEGVTVTDTLGAGLGEPLGATQGEIEDPETGLSTTATFSYEGRTLRWQLGRVPAGMTVWLEFEAAITAQEGTIENAACVEDALGSRRCSNVVRESVAPFAVTLDKRAAPEAVTLGENIRYSLTVSNPSVLLTLEALELRDTLPAGLAYVPGTGTLLGQTALEPRQEGNTLVFRLPPLAPGARHTVSFEARLEALPAPGAAAGVVPDADVVPDVVNRAEVWARRHGTVVASAAASAATVVFTVCDVLIEPGGTVADPGQTVTVLPGETAFLRYTLTNTGNAASDYELEALLVDGVVSPRLAVHLEEAPLGPAITTLSQVPAGERVDLLVAVTRETAHEEAGEAYVDLRGSCAQPPGPWHEGNVAQVVYPLAGFTGPVKEGSGEDVLYQGATIRYSILFTANEAPLADVVVTDTLEEGLGEPFNVTEGEITDPGTGLTTVLTAVYEGRTLRWQLDSVPPGMTVQLEFEVPVETLEGVIENIACVRAIAERCSEPVRYEVRKAQVLFEKRVESRVVRVGDELSYTFSVSNPSPVPAAGIVISDTLPEALDYLPGTSLLLQNDAEEALEPERDGATLKWVLPPVPAESSLELRFRTRVTAAVLTLDALENRATLLYGDEEVLEDSAVAAVEAGAFAPLAVLMGYVFIDENQSGTFERGTDTPLEGVRLYLSDGSYVISDVFGRYTVPQLEPGVMALRLDTTTAPARPLVRTVTEDKPGLWRLRLYPGLITRQDVVFEPAQVTLSVEQALHVARGPIRLSKRVYPRDGGAEVQLDISLAEAREDVRIIEALPAARGTVTAATLDGQPVSFRHEDEQLILLLGALPGGYGGELRYQLQTAETPDSLRTLPEMTWRLR